MADTVRWLGVEVEAERARAIKPIVGLLIAIPALLWGLATIFHVDPLREIALVVAFWTCLITCGTGAKRAWQARDKEGALLPVGVFAGCWLGVPFIAGLSGQLELAYFAALGPAFALVLGFRLLLLYPPDSAPPPSPREEDAGGCYLINGGAGYFRLSFEGMTAEYSTREPERRKYVIRRVAPGEWEKRPSDDDDWEPLQEGFAESFGDFDAIAEAEYLRYRKVSRDS